MYFVYLLKPKNYDLFISAILAPIMRVGTGKQVAGESQF